MNFNIYIFKPTLGGQTKTVYGELLASRMKQERVLAGLLPKYKVVTIKKVQAGPVHSS